MSRNDLPDSKPSLKRVHEEEEQGEEKEEQQPEDSPAKRGVSPSTADQGPPSQQPQSNMNTPNSMTVAANVAASNAAAFHLLASGPLFGGAGPPFPPPPNHPAMAAAMAAAANAANGGNSQVQQEGQVAALHALFGAHGPNAAGVPFGVYPPPGIRQDLLGPIAGYYLDSAAAGFHPYGMDAGRRKNATREVTLPLKTWLNDHRKNPYPTKAEKTILAIITKMTMTQVSTWFANARRRLKKENKMTWSPRNRQADDEDDDDDDDDEVCRNERPSSSVSVLSDEPRRNSLLMEQHMHNRNQHLNGAIDMMISEQKPVRVSDESSSPRKKIWSIAETINQPRTTSSSSSSAADDFKEAKAVDLTSATNTSSSSSSLSPPRPPLLPAHTSNPNDYAAAAFAAALAAATPQLNEANGANGGMNPFLQPPYHPANAAAAAMAMMPGFPFPFMGPNTNPVFANLAAAMQQQQGSQRAQMGAGGPPPQQFMALLAQQQHQQHQQHQQQHMAMMMAAAAAAMQQQQHNHRIQPTANSNPMAAMAAMSGSALSSPTPTSKSAQMVSSRYSDASTPQQNNAGIQRRASSTGSLNNAGSPTTSKPKPQDKPVKSPPSSQQVSES